MLWLQVRKDAKWLFSATPEKIERFAYYESWQLSVEKSVRIAPPFPEMMPFFLQKALTYATLCAIMHQVVQKAGWEST